MLVNVVGRGAENDAVLEAVFEELFGDTGPDHNGRTSSAAQLAERLGTSIEATQLCLDRLKHAGLLGTDPHRSRSGGLELLPKLTFQGKRQDFRVLGDIYAACKHLWPELAVLTTAHAGPRIGPRLTRLVEGMYAAEDLNERHWALVDISKLMIDNCGSPVFQLMCHNIMSVLIPCTEVSTPAIATQLREMSGFEKLAAAVTAGDPESARAAVRTAWDPLWERGMRNMAAMVAAPQTTRLAEM
ncbi:FCD domain-containing protein [Pseudonocardiaceae bacterium YIM PH 21723]|nr:FCD domain-containing protein [Pseudonocardiaceae bacterium YIM PH 21723]